MFCKTCRYNLRGLKTDRFPECGRAFDLSHPETFNWSGRRFDGCRTPGVRTRAAIDLAVGLIWSMTALGDPVSIHGMSSGPFMLFHMWGWWPGIVMFALLGLGVLAPALTWIATGRLTFLAHTILAGMASMAFSFRGVLEMAAAC